MVKDHWLCMGSIRFMITILAKEKIGKEGKVTSFHQSCVFSLPSLPGELTLCLLLNNKHCPILIEDQGWSSNACLAIAFQSNI